MPELGNTWVKIPIHLSEWANIRAAPSLSGWSAIGGLVRNPYALDRSACGSSSGSGAAVAASFAAAALGSDTAGSIICPSSMNGLVGLKPTMGMVSRTHVVPISHSQDMVGPMARSVRDVAILFAAMVAADPADPTTRQAETHKRDFAADLSADALKGVRVAVLRPAMPAALEAVYAQSLAALRRAGAEGIDAMLQKANATILVQPSLGPAWLADPIHRDSFVGVGGSALPAIAGYPYLTVPMGQVKGLPVGLSFIAGAYQDGAVLKAGYAFEQASGARVAPRYLESANVGFGLEGVR